RLQHRRERVSGRRGIASDLCRGWLAAALTLSLGCAPTIDEDVRIAGIGTAQAAREPKPVPHFTETGFVAADGAVLPLRKWLPPRDRGGGEARAVILALHGFNDYSNAFDGPGEIWSKEGIATYAYDQRRFGGAPERRLLPGR